MYQKVARNLSVVTILQMNAKNPFDSMKCEKMNLRKSRSTIFNQLLLKIDSRFPPLARPHWKEENQGFLTVYGMPMDNFFPKNPLIGKVWRVRLSGKWSDLTCASSHKPHRKDLVQIKDCILRVWTLFSILESYVESLHTLVSLFLEDFFKISARRNR